MYDSTTIERFEAKYLGEPNSGCWLWDGATYTKGYGSIRVSGKNMAAHRLSWLIHRGPIPDRLFVLHKCDTPACVNPNHLFLGTNDENMHDMVQKGRHVAWHSRKTHCLRGHEFTPENTRLRPNGWRSCRACDNSWRDRAGRR